MHLYYYYAFFNKTYIINGMEGYASNSEYKGVFIAGFNL